MIPKKIHYVWVGGKEKPDSVRRCMATWEKYLGEYEIIEWNESNVDMNENKFIQQAYAQKKWAYVSDYIRAKVIYEQGGIYLDTDVMVLDDLKQYLDNRAFVGFENPQYPFTATFGCEQHHPLAKKMMDYFTDRDFEFDVDNQRKEVNTKTVSDILIQDYHCVPNNEEQVLAEGIHVYPDYIFCIPSLKGSTIHVFNSSWVEGKEPIKNRILHWIRLRLTTPGRLKLYMKIFG